jgi:EAL and modified HD-GYP domain-containing signal transduction protein
MQKIYIGRQPILDRKARLVAFELLPRLTRERQAPRAGSETTDNAAADPMSASAELVMDGMAGFGMQEILGTVLGYLNIDQQFLMSDLVSTLPHEHVVLELRDSISFDDQVIERCKALKAEGYRLALGDISKLNGDMLKMLPMVDVVKVDVTATETSKLRPLVKILRRWPVTLVAEKVETPERARDCADIGFDYFQGYYFAKPEVLSGRRTRPAKVELTRLLALVLRDADVRQLENAMKVQPNITYNLLRIVNSVAYGLRVKIGSVRQAILLLGRAQLRRWLLLMMYAAERSDTNAQSALLQLAATRGRLMEILATKDKPKDEEYQERAFMCGILSLLDVVLELPMSSAVEQLTLDDSVKESLLARTGRLGELLKLVEKKELDDPDELSVALEYLSFVSLDELVSSDAEAAIWAARLLTEDAHAA